MSRQIKGILVSRLVVAISIILVPIATFLIFNLVDFALWFSDDPVLNFWILQILCPLVFSISWVFFLGLFASHIAETLDAMDDKVGTVSIHYKMFFGINALFIMMIFVIPLITPFVSILSFSSIAWKLTTFRKDWIVDDKVHFGTKISIFFAALIPLFCSVCILPDYLELAAFILFDIWFHMTHFIFTVSYCLVTALAFGSLGIMLKNRGISDYKQMRVNKETEETISLIKLMEIPLFAFFLYLALGEFDVISFFYQMGWIIMILTSLVNYIQGKRKISNFKSYFLGYLLTIIFMGAKVVLFSDIYSEFILFPEINLVISEFIQVMSLIFSAGLFIVVFFYTFFTVESSYL
ncbi:MAG: hypothetical protein ACOC44_05815 [Promethearchaeia archaeon]